MRYRDAMGAQSADVVAVEPDRMRCAEAIGEQAERLQIRDQARAIPRVATRGLRPRLRQMRLQPDAVITREPVAFGEKFVGAMQRDRRPKGGTDEAAVEVPVREDVPAGFECFTEAKMNHVPCLRHPSRSSLLA